jgi:putative photosynthetic complex assembly protein
MIETISVPKPEPMRFPVLLGAALIAIVLATAGYARLTEVGTVRLQPVVAASSLDLIFTDRADGAMVATEARHPERVHVADPKTDGFMRVAVSGMTRERAMAEKPLDAPFTLMRDTGGRLWLEDPQMGKRIALDAFGPVNARAFSKLLDERRSTP